MQITLTPHERDTLLWLMDQVTFRVNEASLQILATLVGIQGRLQEAGVPAGAVSTESPWPALVNVDGSRP